MKAVVVTAAGGPEMLDVRQVGEPELPAGHVLLDVAWGACNWGDIQKRRDFAKQANTSPYVVSQF